MGIVINIPSAFHTQGTECFKGGTPMKKITVDGNTAVSHVAYAFSDVAAI